jgi:tRNA(fMet)-specific endonuclease VapC
MSALRYLLDTNVIAAMVKQPRGALAQRLAGLPRESFAISVVVAAEVRYGLSRKASPKLTNAVEAVIAAIDIVPLEEPADRHYGEIRAELARLGQPIGHNDLFIAAHARALGAVLITANVSEFARVPGLKVENWLADSLE